VSDGAGSRAAAVRAVSAVLGAGATLEGALGAETHGERGAADRALVQALAYGAIRFGQRLGRVAAAMLPRPFETLAAELQSLLLVGLYQLEYSRTAPHAAVSTTVEAARHVGAARASGLVNALLRRFQRERAALLALADATLAGRSSHPEWLVAALERDWPRHAATILAANNEHPPLTLRANATRTTTAALLAELAAAGHEARAVPFAPRAVVLGNPVDVRGLPAFIAGRCSVQDAAAQLAAPLLGVGRGARVLDACAAPGGKACHLLEEQPDLAELVAADLDPRRAALIEDNLARLGLVATVQVADAMDPASFDGSRFDGILLDAPCSGTGVIRRHPDIKFLRRASDLPALAARQIALLEALWPRLLPRGRLLYASCSVLKAENAAVVAEFLRRTPEAVDVTESASLAVPGLPPQPGMAGPGIALLPGLAGTDGFYYACLQRRPHSAFHVTGLAARSP
jgi:16S rRNA (cytosine967-C5)-methyltransferase